MSDTALINYDEELIRHAARLQHALAPSSGNYISLKSKTFTLPDGRASQTLDCIVLDYIRINALYPPWQPNVRSNARCWALGYSDKELAPSPSAPEPQAENCADCPQNKWGTATNGGRGKACGNRYRLVVVPPDASSDSQLWLLTIAPTSLKHWNEYVELQNSLHGKMGFARVVTQLTFDPSFTYPVVKFKALRKLESIEIIAVMLDRAIEANKVEPVAE